MGKEMKDNLQNICSKYKQKMTKDISKVMKWNSQTLKTTETRSENNNSREKI